VAATDVAATRTRVAMVVPPFALVTAPVADLRAEPRDACELVDQLHYMEQPMPRVLGERDGWYYVNTEDHYFGWVHGDLVQVMPGAGDGRVVGSALAAIHSAPDPGSPAIGYLPAGTGLAHRQLPEPPEGWVRIPSAFLERSAGAIEAFVSLDDAASIADLPHRYPTPDDLIATAEDFLGVPYLWGGTTALGMDCSGFVQQVYRLNGVRLDRDAHQQAVEGRPVDVPARGDLIFFGSSEVTHVGVAVDEHSFLNAPEAGKKVRLDDLRAGGRNVLAIRRYLP